MAGLSAEVRERLNKGYSLYKSQLGDLLHEALVDAAEDKEEDNSWGEGLAKMLESKLDKKDFQEVMAYIEAQKFLRPSDLAPITDFLLSLQTQFGSAENLKTSFLSISDRLDKIAADVAALTP
jgi:hypothetical protein